MHKVLRFKKIKLQHYPWNLKKQRFQEYFSFFYSDFAVIFNLNMICMVILFY